jgi:hypothetical protein
LDGVLITGYMFRIRGRIKGEKSHGYHEHVSRYIQTCFWIKFFNEWQIHVFLHSHDATFQIYLMDTLTIYTGRPRI